MMKFDIESANIYFKNLLSGPAPTGRILNYIYLIGTTGLKHRNGNRTTNLKNNIGYAWTTEFMIGLGLVSLGKQTGEIYELELTDNGKALFDLMKGNYTKFNEGFRDSAIRILKDQIDACHPLLYEQFKAIFSRSYPFLVLREFLLEEGFHYKNNNQFTSVFFDSARKMYDKDASSRISAGNAGFNRVPSLTQLCKLFGFLKPGKEVHFVSREFLHTETSPITREFTEHELLDAAAEEKKLIEVSADLEEKYGEDGTVLVSAIVRNSALQSKFKHNLMIAQDGKCVLCGMTVKDLLIGSHIKESAESDVHEKVDHNNGLLLCCNHDKVFDRHLITFDATDGQIKISESLSKEDSDLLGLDSSFKLAKELLCPERVKYLKLHNEKYDAAEEKRKIVR